MAKNKINDLRDHLFETLEALKDADKPMELDRARAIADVSRVIVETAKVEVKFLEVTGALPSTGFLPEGEADAHAPKPKLIGAKAGRAG